MSNPAIELLRQLFYTRLAGGMKVEELLIEFQDLGAFGGVQLVHNDLLCLSGQSQCLACTTCTTCIACNYELVQRHLRICVEPAPPADMR